MNISCFPVAARPYSAESKDASLVDLGLLGEIADEVVSLFRRPSRPGKQAKTARPLTESERAVLAKNAGTPVPVLEHLSFDQSTIVRNELVFNPAVPRHVLRNLAGDSDRFIAGQARARLADAA